MRVLRGAVTHLAIRGYFTLQVPDLAVGHGSDDFEELPDEWFVKLKWSGGRPAHARESGLLFLTRIGYDANRERLRQSLETWLRGYPAGRGPGLQTWEDFERVAEMHFKSVAARLATYERALREKLGDVERWKAIV
jgi:hypothetical protein